jgi:osmotically-inducible protein OsmY
MDEEPSKYLVGRVREALARDERTNVLDIQVLITAGRLYLLGQVTCESRKDAVEAVTRENVPDAMPIVNELWVESYQEPEGSEKLS